MQNTTAPFGIACASLPVLSVAVRKALASLSRDSTRANPLSSSSLASRNSRKASAVRAPE